MTKNFKVKWALRSQVRSDVDKTSKVNGTSRLGKIMQILW